jgi:DNA-nicking Smr family endonuclease
VTKKSKGFHTPFEKLKDVKLPTPANKREAEAKAKAEAEAKAKAKAEAEPRADDVQLFADEMSGVERLTEDPRGRLGAPPPPERAESRRARDDAEAYAQLADLVEGAGTFDVADTDEYIEGLAPGIDRRLMRKLRHGDYAVQAHVDLHGLTADAARAEVERFVDRARADGKRCVLIVHGRGLHSKDALPVLKERLKVWLTRGRLARAVLAFTTARPSDGGAGAVYVLLRRA